MKAIIFFLSMIMASMTGDWTGHVESNGYEAPVYMRLTQIGNQVSGQFAIVSGKPQFEQIGQKYHVSGFISDSEIYMVGYPDKNVTIEFYGFVDRDRITGVWKIYTQQYGLIRTEPWVVERVNVLEKLAKR